MGEFRYRAFISYSWADAKWGNWVHRKLETFRTPAALIGMDGAHGEVPARLAPLFKDREEQSAGSSIGAAVERALAGSEYLIVVCSPQSAKSQWVAREISWFKTHRDPDKVLAIIVEGEPGGGDAECFPKALTHRVGSDMAVVDELADAPLAADARITGDGKRRAILKLAAPMLGVDLDELVNRDERRRTMRTRGVVAASLALALVMSGLAWAAVQARFEADRQRDEADGLVEFMLTDLRDKLEPVGRLDALDVVGDRALAYYAGQDPGALDADALGRRARALLLVGEISNLRGESAAAMKAFREAAHTTAEQLARDPRDGQRVYDHSQSVFWVGAVAYSRGELAEAEAQFREYQRLAGMLVEIDPAKPEWQMESSYAESNMGVLMYEQGRFEEAEGAFATGLERIEAVAAREGFDAGRQIEIGQTIDWLAQAKAPLAKYREALALFRREVALYEEVLRRDPANASARNRLSVAWQMVGEQELNLGDLDASLAAYDRSLAINAELRELEPDNAEWQETGVRGGLSRAEALIHAGKLAEGAAMIDAAGRMLDRMIASDPTNAVWSQELRATEARTAVMLALAEGDPPRAARYADIAVDLAGVPEGSNAAAARAHLLAGEVRRHARQPARARESWVQALALLPSYPDADEDRFILLKRLGRSGEAAEVAARLDRRGYRNPAYLRER